MEFKSVCCDRCNPDGRPGRGLILFCDTVAAIKDFDWKLAENGDLICRECIDEEEERNNDPKAP